MPPPFKLPHLTIFEEYRQVHFVECPRFGQASKFLPKVQPVGPVDKLELRYETDKSQGWIQKFQSEKLERWNAIFQDRETEKQQVWRERPRILF